MFDAIPSPDPALLLFISVIAVLPGPLNILLLTSGLAGRARYGAGVLLAGALCYGILYAVAASLIREIASHHAFVLDWLQVASVLLLLWMAWRIATAPVGVATADVGRGFSFGLLTGAGIVLVGSKSTSSAIAAGSLYCDGRLSVAEHALVFGFSAGLLALVWCTPWLLAGLWLGRSLSSPGAQKAVNVLGAGTMVLLAGTMVV